MISISGRGSISSYVKALENPTLADWQKLLGEDVRVHLNPSVVKIEDLTVRPQPLYDYNALYDTAKGEIIIKYRAIPYDNSSGLFELVNVKPRTYRLILNEEALSFKRSVIGNLVIDKKTILKFIPPKGAKLIDINPIPEELREEKFPIYIESVEWNDVVLVEPVLVFEYEETIGEEIYRFFEEYSYQLINFFTTPEGIFVVLFFVLLSLFYSKLNYSLTLLRRRGKNVK